MSTNSLHFDVDSEMGVVVGQPRKDGSCPLYLHERDNDGGAYLFIGITFPSLAALASTVECAVAQVRQFEAQEAARKEAGKQNGIESAEVPRLGERNKSGNH